MEPERIDSKQFLARLIQLKIDAVVSVPDSRQRGLLDRLRDSSIMLVTATTEDQAVAIAAGLTIAGKRVVVSIQNSGVFAALNALRTLTLDMKIPTTLLVGLYGYKEHKSRAISKLSSLLAMMESDLTVWISSARRFMTMEEGTLCTWILTVPIV